MRYPLLAVLLACLLAPAACGQEAAEPFDAFTRAWRNDRVWYDGQAECAVYDATRTIYGQPRHYQARLFTNKEYADPETKTKSASNRGREVFKHHVRDDIATPNYDYHFSTMVYVGTSDLKSLKIDMGSQEDCGTTFKQFVNHAGTLSWEQFSYFPDEGHRRGSYAPPGNLVFHDALSVVLRGYPFDQPRDIDLMVIEDQTTTHLSDATPKAMTLSYIGRETLDLPIGQMPAHHLRIGAHDYWFAADPALQHVMVRYEGPNAMSYRLAQVERRAYWER
jgi:hypothetical protein